MPIERRHRVVFYGVVAPCTLGALVAMVQVFCLFANDRSSGSHDTGALLGQVFFLFVMVAAILAIAGACAFACGGLVYVFRRSRHAVWVGWLPWIVAAAAVGSFALRSP